MKESHREWFYDELLGLAYSLDERVTYSDATAALVNLAAEVVKASEEAQG